MSFYGSNKRPLIIELKKFTAFYCHWNPFLSDNITYFIMKKYNIA